MILTALFNLGYVVISGIISALPAGGGFPSQVYAAASTLGGYFGMFSAVAPIGTLATVLTIIFSVEIGIFGYKTLKSIAAHIPFVGGAGH